MTGLRELRERIAGLTGPDREVDAALWALTNCVDDTTYLYGAGGYPDGTRIKSYRRPGPRWFAPRYTASLDAALSLVERLLPRWSIAMVLSEGYQYPVVKMGRSYPTNATVAMEHKSSLCCAVLLALLDALILSSSPTPGGEDNG